MAEQQDHEAGVEDEDSPGHGAEHEQEDLTDQEGADEDGEGGDPKAGASSFKGIDLRGDQPGQGTDPRARQNL